MLKSHYKFSVPKGVLAIIPPEKGYVRKQGGTVGLKLTTAPHIIISPSWGSYITYSNENFVFPSRQIGISSQNPILLKTLAIYLNSSMVAYHVFFHSSEWGIFRQAKRVSIAEVREIPTPRFTAAESEELCSFYDHIATKERRQISEYLERLKKRRLGFNNNYIDDSEYLTATEEDETVRLVVSLRDELQREIDSKIYSIYKIPEDIQILIDDFFQSRLPLDTPNYIQYLAKQPSEKELFEYAKYLQQELDVFLMGEAFHKIEINTYKDFIECIVEIINTNKPFPITKESIRKAPRERLNMFAGMNSIMEERVSQWSYVQRGLRIFDGPKIHIFKKARLIDWTRTQAITDGDDIIGEVIGTDHQG